MNGLPRGSDGTRHKDLEPFGRQEETRDPCEEVMAETARPEVRPEGVDRCSKEGGQDVAADIEGSYRVKAVYVYVTRGNVKPKGMLTLAAICS